MADRKRPDEYRVSVTTVWREKLNVKRQTDSKTYMPSPCKSLVDPYTVEEPLAEGQQSF